MNSDARIPYWLKNQPIQNFGDMLSESLFDSLTQKSLVNWTQGRRIGDYDVVHLIGSCISNWHIERDLEFARAGGGKRIAFWGCGVRDEKPLRPSLLEHCVFLGVRGPLTRDVLGLPKHTAIGDPGLLMPYVYEPTLAPLLSGTTVCVPHFLEKKTDDELLSMSGCQLVVRPNLAGSAGSVERFIDTICSAKFVLAGALHAAIVAYAYGKPFAYFDSGYIDVPIKWQDFAASIHMPFRFVQTIDEGQDFFKQESGGFKMPARFDILKCAPYRPPRRLVRKIASADK